MTTLTTFDKQYVAELLEFMGRKYKSVKPHQHSLSKDHEYLTRSSATILVNMWGPIMLPETQDYWVYPLVSALTRLLREEGNHEFYGEQIHNQTLDHGPQYEGWESDAVEQARLTARIKRYRADMNAALNK